VVAAAGEQAEGLVGHEPADQRADQRAAVPDPGGGEQPERDLEQDVEQREGDQQGGEPTVDRPPEQPQPVRCQQHVQSGDQGEALHQLDGQ
jgi:hypothetical protein